MNMKETMSREVEIRMPKNTQQVPARDGDSQADILRHSCHCLLVTGSCAVPELQVSFIHTGLVLLLGTDTKMQTG